MESSPSDSDQSRGDRSSVSAAGAVSSPPPAMGSPGQIISALQPPLPDLAPFAMIKGDYLTAYSLIHTHAESGRQFEILENKISHLTYLKITCYGRGSMMYEQMWPNTLHVLLHLRHLSIPGIPCVHECYNEGTAYHIIMNMRHPRCVPLVRAQGSFEQASLGATSATLQFHIIFRALLESNVFLPTCALEDFIYYPATGIIEAWNLKQAVFISGPDRTAFRLYNSGTRYPEEVASDAPIDPSKATSYNLGALVHHLVTGRAYSPDPDAEEQSSIGPFETNAIKSFVYACLNPNPDYRPNLKTVTVVTSVASPHITLTRIPTCRIATKRCHRSVAVDSEDADEGPAPQRR